jgi:hypothetical protein
MAAAAEAIAVVQVEKGSARQPYRATVREVMGGELAARLIEVYEPAPWRGPFPAFATTEALLFLVRNPRSGRWEVIGPSGEGRVTLDVEFAYFTGIDVPGATPGRYTVNGTEYNGARYPRTTLTAALGDLNRCYRWERNEKGYTPVAQCGADSIASLRTKSPLHDYLFERVPEPEQGAIDCGLLAPRVKKTG